MYHNWNTFHPLFPDTRYIDAEQRILSTRCQTRERNKGLPILISLREISSRLSSNNTPREQDVEMSVAK